MPAPGSCLSVRTGGSCRAVTAPRGTCTLQSVAAFLRPHLQRLSRFLQGYGRSLLVLLFGLLLPMLGFLVIASELYQQDPFHFEKPLMLWVRAGHSGAFDRLAAGLSLFGNTPGMLPLNAVLTVWLYRFHPRAAYFLLLSLAGSIFFHAALKPVFDRPRPTFWTPILPEADFSFPSGHAMFATSLVSALALLAWPTRWRFPVLGLGTPYVLVMMWSRVYSGVHYPTDVLGGAFVALVWVIGLGRHLQAHRLLKPDGETARRLPAE